MIFRKISEIGFVHIFFSIRQILFCQVSLNLKKFWILKSIKFRTTSSKFKECVENLWTFLKKRTQSIPGKVKEDTITENLIFFIIQLSLFNWRFQKNSSHLHLLMLALKISSKNFCMRVSERKTSRKVKVSSSNDAIWINSHFPNHCVDYFNNVSSRFTNICNMNDVPSVHLSLLAFFNQKFDSK